MASLAEVEPKYQGGEVGRKCTYLKETKPVREKWCRCMALIYTNAILIL
jgi:hypothetical protein